MIILEDTIDGPQSAFLDIKIIWSNTHIVSYLKCASFLSYILQIMYHDSTEVDWFLFSLPTYVTTVSLYHTAHLLLLQFFNILKNDKFLLFKSIINFLLENY